MRARVGSQKGPRFALCLGILLATFSMTISAQVFMSEAEALKITVPGAVSFKSEEKQLTPPQRESLQRNNGLNFREQSYKTYLGIGNNGSIVGYAFLMNEIGKEEYITFLVGVTPKGDVGDVVILEYRESRGGEVKEKRFMRQFRNKRSSDPIQVDRDIVNYTGATLSSKAIARGVKKALLLADLFYLQKS